MKRSQIGKDLRKGHQGRWESLLDGCEAGGAWHILGIVRRLVCLELSMSRRVSDLGGVAKTPCRA